MKALRWLLSLFCITAPEDRAGNSGGELVLGRSKLASGEPIPADLAAESGRCPLKVLGGAETSFSCAIHQVFGRRLILSLSDPIRQGHFVEISWQDTLIFGEVVGCWQEDLEPCAAVDLEHSLIGIEHLRAICANFTSYAKP
jgi:hypothetical protein